MEWSCEEDIIRDLQHGDRKAYSFLFKKYYPMLCAYCSRFVSLEDAEEIVQDNPVLVMEEPGRDLHQQVIGAIPVTDGLS